MADVVLVESFLAGMLAFFTPCVLPILPAFVGFIAGGTQVARAVRLARTLLFVLGFAIAFVALGFVIASAASTFGGAVFETWLRRIGGTLIIVFGLAMTGLIQASWLQRDLRFHGKAPSWLGPGGAALFLGAAFGLGWSPCVGPILGTILIQAGLDGGGARGALLLGTFALGLAVPFVATGLAADRGAAWLRRLAPVTRVVEVVGGVLLIVLGMFIFTGAANRLLLYLSV